MVRNRLIFDTDGGADDAQALLLLIGNGRPPDAITTVFGNVDVDTATGNVLATLAVAGATIEVHKGAAEALVMVEPLAARLSGYFHFHGVRGGLLMQLGRHREARAAFDQAIALAGTAAEAAHIRMHLDRLIKDSEAPEPARTRTHS